MSKSSGALTRALAAKAVDGVITHGRNLDAALHQHIHQELSDRDKSLVRALAYGALRTHLRNRAIIKMLIQKPLKKKDSVVEALLSIGLFALTESERPDYAVVSATVGAADKLDRKHLRGLVNAVLRNFLRDKEKLLAALTLPEAVTGHPQWLVERFRKDWPDHCEAIIAAANRQAPMWVRVNEQRLTTNEWLQQCAPAEISASAPVKELPSACLLATPAGVADLPGFAIGHCSVQDVASQVPAQLLALEPQMQVLDACAAPGGKTCHILERFPGVELLALDNVPERLERLEENLERLDLRAEIRCADVLEVEQWWDGRLFDRILIDAPCSATGVIRRHPDIRFLRRPNDIDALSKTQSVMLDVLWTLLKPGGRLLYSTCSIMRAENDSVVAAFLDRTDDAQEAALPDWLKELSAPAAIGVQLLPGTFDNDGFYYALLQKSA